MNVTLAKVALSTTSVTLTVSTWLRLISVNLVITFQLDKSSCKLVQIVGLGSTSDRQKEDEPFAIHDLIQLTCWLVCWVLQLTVCVV